MYTFVSRVSTWMSHSINLKARSQPWYHYFSKKNANIIKLLFMCRSLSIYPSGNTKGNGHGHVSIYLAFMDPTSLPIDWEINAIINFSAYNFVDDEYVTTQGTNFNWEWL